LITAFIFFIFINFLYFIVFNYLSDNSGAPTGQTAAQAPQSMQSSGSITYLSSPCDIAFTGHSIAHTPQEIQFSFILYDKVFTPLKVLKLVIVYLLFIYYFFDYPKLYLL
jgi:hypothetical protein